MQVASHHLHVWGRPPEDLLERRILRFRHVFDCPLGTSGVNLTLQEETKAAQIKPEINAILWRRRTWSALSYRVLVVFNSAEQTMFGLFASKIIYVIIDKTEDSMSSLI